MPSVELIAGMMRRPVRYCSQKVTRKPKAPSPRKSAIHTPSMRRMRAALRTTPPLARPSSPWSRNSPRGLVWPVRRACAPSMLSAVM